MVLGLLPEVAEAVEVLKFKVEVLLPGLAALEAEVLLLGLAAVEAEVLVAPELALAELRFGLVSAAEAVLDGPEVLDPVLLTLLLSAFLFGLSVVELGEGVLKAEARLQHLRNPLLLKGFLRDVPGGGEVRLFDSGRFSVSAFDLLASFLVVELAFHALFI